MKPEDLKIGNYYRIKKGCEGKCGNFSNDLKAREDRIIKLTTNFPNQNLYYDIVEEQSKNQLGGCFSCFNAEDLEEYAENAVNQPKFKIGDKVEFVRNGKRIPEYFTNYSPANIPREKLIHGTCNLGSSYTRDKAKIVDKHNEYYIVEWEDTYGKTMRLGFLPESLKPSMEITPKLSDINEPLIPQPHVFLNPKNIMSNITTFVKNLALSKDEKLLRKHGLHDECSQPTETYKALVLDKLFKDNEAYVVEMAAALDKEEKEKK